jgi:hypothetical protein
MTFDESRKSDQNKTYPVSHRLFFVHFRIIQNVHPLLEAFLFSFFQLRNRRLLNLQWFHAAPLFHHQSFFITNMNLTIKKVPLVSTTDFFLFQYQVYLYFPFYN